MAPGNSRNAFPKMQKVANESLMAYHHVLASRNLSWRVRDLYELQQGTDGGLATFHCAHGACVFSEAKQSGSQERKCTDKQRMLPRLEHILCFLNWGQAEVGVNRGAKIMRRWCQHFEPGPPNSEVTQGCYISSYISSLNFSSLLSCSHVFYLWNPQSCTLLSDQSYVVSSLIYSLWKGLDYKQ